MKEAVKSGHYAFQNRPLGVETGQYHLMPDSRALWGREPRAPLLIRGPYKKKAAEISN